MSVIKARSWSERARPHDSATLGGRSSAVDHAGVDGVLEVVGAVGHPVSQAHDLTFGGGRGRPGP